MNKQGEVFQNQKKIGHYSNIANNALNDLLNIQKDLFDKKCEVIPNRAWMVEARK